MNETYEKLVTLFAYIKKYGLILTYDRYKKQWVISILEAEHVEDITEYERADSLEELLEIVYNRLCEQS